MRAMFYVHTAYDERSHKLVFFFFNFGEYVHKIPNFVNIACAVALALHQIIKYKYVPYGRWHNA